MSNIKPFDLNLIVKGEEISVKFLFDLDKFSIQVMYSYLSQGKLYEPDLSYFLMKILGKSDVFLDVGAHVGFFSVIAGKLVGPEGCVVAFEPEEENLQSLKKHVEINGVSNIEVVDKVVCDTDGPRTFYINRDNDGGHCLWDVGVHPFNKKSAADPKPLTIEAVSLDTALAERRIENVKLLKIDTEGGEHQVCKGARQALEKHAIPFVVCELNDFGLEQLDSSQENFRAFMKDLGYDTFLMDGDGEFPKLLPNSVAIASKSKSVSNVLFSRLEFLTPYWNVETIE
ncbi:MAG: FkbM family methyltransferase [Rhodospirillales bacterium]|nr:FkbM family methyltransferase [Rhodospirillales bacterium]MDP6774752.1 FkbM family methyltransferase [Rhodospirillales bacterium]